MNNFDFSYMQQKEYSPMNSGSVFNIFKEEQTLLKEASELNQKLNQKSHINNPSNFELNENINLSILEEVNRRSAEKKFGYFLTEAYFESLILDEDFKLQNENKIKSYFLTSIIESYGSISNLMEACKDNSKLLNKKVNEAKKCGKKMTEKCTAELAEETGKNSKDKKDLSEFAVSSFLDKNEDNFVDYDKADISEISNAVKDKVIATIKDEKNRQEENKEFLQSVKDAREENIVSESSLFLNGQEDFSLYKSIMMKHYKSTVHNLKESSTDDSLYGTLSESGEIKVNMDYVMCDTLLEYTQLELLNTMKIKKFDCNEVRKLAESYAYINLKNK